MCARRDWGWPEGFSVQAGFQEKHHNQTPNKYAAKTQQTKRRQLSASPMHELRFLVRWQIKMAIKSATLPGKRQRR